MKYFSTFKENNLEFIDEIMSGKTVELFKAALPEFEDDRRYSVRLKRGICPEKPYGKNVYEIMLEVEPIPVNYAVYVPPKEIYLKPTESFREKLRNIWHYLRDQDGGRWEYREARK